MIPIIINNFNWYSTTKKLVENLLRLGYNDIHILDNDSTYEPLLSWYKEVEGEIKVVRLNQNVGPRALWDSGYMQNFQHLDWIAYTDSDIELNENTPKDFIEQLISVAMKLRVPERRNDKVGLALEIDTLPDSNYNRKIKAWESKYWDKPLDYGTLECYDANIDTTFAVIRPQHPFDYKGIRIADNFTAKHIPWYTNYDNLTDEEKYVLDHSDSTVSNYKGNYLRHLKEKGKQND